MGDDGLARGVELAGGEVIEADAVVSDADMHHTETALLEPEHQWQPERRWAKRQPGVSALLVFAGVRGELPELAHHSLFFSRDWEANFADIVGDGELKPPFPASVYVSRVTATQPDAAPAGHENLYMLVPFPADPELGATPASREQLEEYAWRYLDQVAAWASIPDLRERTTLYRVTTPSDFATELSAWRGSALGLEHTVRPVGDVPARQRLPQGAQPAVRGLVDRARHRHADLPDLGGAGGQAAARFDHRLAPAHPRPARLPRALDAARRAGGHRPQGGQGVTFAYLAALLVSICGPWLPRLALPRGRVRAAAPRARDLGIGVAVFLAWDVAGVGLGIFFRGDAQYMTGVLLAPEVPLEELFFLTLLNYQTLLLWRALDSRRERKGGAA